ncbi:MAG TPA: triple tyrosine motif-containing protein, partial [Pedobacter sp.]|nr:triple tyrosine motif-containing protein [Pedobacter sp.]
MSEFDRGKLTVSSRGKGTMNIAYNDSLDFTKASWNRAVFDNPNVAGDSLYAHVWDVLKNAANGEIWYACQAGRMIRFNERTKRTTFFNDPVFSGEHVQHIVTDDLGQVWAGTSGGRIVVYNGKGFELKLYVGSGVNKMLMTTGGLLWLGTENKGVFVVDPKTARVVKRYSSGDKGSVYSDNNPVNDILEINPHSFVLACTGSLDFIDTRTGKQTSCNGNNGLPSFIVYALQADKEGKLWLSTNGGLFNYDFKTNSFEGKEGLVKTTNEWNVLTNSTKLHDDKLLFAGPNSFLIFDPLKIKDHKKPYNVAITDFRLFNRYLPLDSVYREKELKLDYNQNSLSISFSSFNFDSEDNYKYYYRMIGADTTWIRADKNLTASFAALRPGNYTFMVKSINSEGIASPSVTRLPIYIRPAYWQTWWFVLLL